MPNPHKHQYLLCAVAHFALAIATFERGLPIALAELLVASIYIDLAIR